MPKEKIPDPEELVEDCKHEMVARFADGSAHCERCGVQLSPPNKKELKND